jgi:hypothetical protein
MAGPRGTQVDILVLKDQVEKRMEKDGFEKNP